MSNSSEEEIKVLNDTASSKVIVLMNPSSFDASKSTFTMKNQAEQGLSISDNIDLLALKSPTPIVTSNKNLLLNASSSAFTALNNCPNVLITQDTLPTKTIAKDPVESIIPKLLSNKDSVAPSVKSAITTPTIHKINHNKMTNEITISTPNGKTLTLMTNNVRNFNGPRPNLPTITNKTIVTYPKPSTLPTRVIPVSSSETIQKAITDLPMKTPPQRTYARVSPSINPINIPTTIAGSQITINKLKIPQKDSCTKMEEISTDISSTIISPLSIPMLKSEVEPQKKVLAKRLNAGVMQKALQKVESELLGSATKSEPSKVDTSIEIQCKKVAQKKRIPIGNRFSYMKFSPELPSSETVIDAKSKPIIINLTSEKAPTSMLLCDEMIDSNSPEGSPENSKKSTDSTSEVAPDVTSVTNVKQNLDRKLSVEGNLMIDEEGKEDPVESEKVEELNEPITATKSVEIIEVNDVTITEDIEEPISKLESPVSTSMDYDEFLSKSEISKSTINQDESLPVKKGRTATTKGRGKYVRKPKADKEEKTGVELEQEYNDPLKYIKWNDGVGTLKQCKKQFGFNEFGMIEILNQREVQKNRIKTYDTTGTDGLLIKLEEKYHCCICKKSGDIREFVMNEYCSEACVAIGKRKRNEKEGEKQQDFSIIPQVAIPEPPPPRKKNRRKSQLTSTKLNQANRFQWSNYLTAKSVPAPLCLFLNPYPKTNNPFSIGMKLEAIDPENQSLFCVCTVKELQGYRIKLHFDGSTILYDFWVNADSKNIFPAGFCRSSSRTLQAPPKFKINFNWAEYLVATNSVSAHRNCFPHFNCEKNPFEVGMKMEVDDLKWTGQLSVASVIDCLDNRILVHFDGRDITNCVWLNIKSPYLHPFNYHKTLKNKNCLLAPPDWKEEPFAWSSYLKKTKGGCVAHADLFCARPPFDFVPSLKLEVVDKVNPQLIRPATVLNRNEYKVQVIFDGFDINFSYWIEDDSDDIHPIDWCEKSGHPIEHPAGFDPDISFCPTAGCRGVGNGVFESRTFHDRVQECPYFKENWEKKSEKKRPLRVAIGNTLNSSQKPLNVVASIPEHSSSKRSAKSAFSNAKVTGSRKRKSDESYEELNESPVKIEIEDDDYEMKSLQFTTVDDHVKVELNQPMSYQWTKQIEATTVNKYRIRASKRHVQDYGPQLLYSHKLWTQNSKVLDHLTNKDFELTKNPLNWSISEVSNYISRLPNCSNLVKTFINEEIDGAALLCLCQDDLINLLNIKLGAAIKIYNRIVFLREEVTQRFVEC
ncbi:unnamed protein product [Diamesa serratosioi]